MLEYRPGQEPARIVAHWDGYADQPGWYVELQDNEGEYMDDSTKGLPIDIDLPEWEHKELEARIREVWPNADVKVTRP